ncbi:MAG: 30S ribosomal protein S9 [Fibrobacteres bacterium]|nr:30S ribosomal protein S9 [Fibrobacterota bacterium]
MAKKEIRAVGRRKTSVARVRMVPGNEPIKVNGRSMMEYFCNERYKFDAETPLRITEKVGSYSIDITLDGGGLTGQAAAARLGIARALCIADSTLRTVLKKEGMLTRDAREVERQKYGQKGARAHYQFSKR